MLEEDIAEQATANADVLAVCEKRLLNAHREVFRALKNTPARAILEAASATSTDFHLDPFAEADNVIFGVPLRIRRAAARLQLSTIKPTRVASLHGWLGLGCGSTIA